MADCGPDLALQAKVGSPDLGCASGESVEDIQICFCEMSFPAKDQGEPGPAEAPLGVRKSKGPRAGAGREGQSARRDRSSRRS